MIRKSYKILVFMLTMLMVVGFTACGKDMRPSVKNLKYFYNGLVSAKNEEGKYGFINNKGETKIAFEYDHASFVYGGSVLVQKEQKYFLINAKGKELSAKYDNIFFTPYKAVFVASNNTADGGQAEIADFLNGNGKKIFELETKKFNNYDLYYGGINNYLIISNGKNGQDKKRGIIDITNGKTIFETEYDSVDFTANTTS